MPTWLLHYLLPIIVSSFTPIAVEYVKKAAEWLRGRLPSSVVVVLTTTIAEGVNQAQSILTGTALPPGVGTLIAVLLNELGNDLNVKPPTPGVR
jgi:hypothetical protein